MLKLTSNERKSVFLLTTEDIWSNITENLIWLIWHDYQVNTQKVENLSWWNLFYEDNKIWLIIKWKQDFPDYVYNAIKSNIDSDKTLILFWQPFEVDLSKSASAIREPWKLENILKDKFDLWLSKWIIWDKKYNSSINFRQWFISYTLPYPYFVKAFTPKDLPINQWVENVSLPFIPSLESWTNDYKIENILKTSSYAFEDNDINNLSPNKRLNISSWDIKEFVIWKTFIKWDFSFTAIPSIHLFDMVQWNDMRNNILFTSNLIDWLWWDKRLIEIRSKNINFSIFDASNEQKKWIKAINIYVVPIFLVLLWIWISLFIWSKRKL